MAPLRPGVPAARRLGAALAIAVTALLAPGAVIAGAEDLGTLVITKQVSAGAGPDAGIFRFDGSWGEAFSLTAGESQSTALPEGDYSITEELVPGYRFLGIRCSGPSGQSAFTAPAAAVRVASGQVTGCTSRSQPEINIDVEPEITGNALLRVRRRCSRPRRLVAEVRSGNARQVSFRVGGSWVKTVRRPVRGKLFRLVKRVGRRALTVSARVLFTTGSSPPEARLAKSLPRCPRAPAFAGALPAAP